MSQRIEQLERAFQVIEHLEAEIASLRAAQAEPIAVVGLSCRFPGAEDADAFWSLLEAGREAITEVPPERWDIDALHDPDPDAPGKMSTRFGGFLKDVDRFDAQFFNISPREAEMMDPQQRLLLELSWEALENAAISPDALGGSSAGVFVGICTSDYPRLAALNVENLNAYWGTGGVTSVAAGRIAYTFGFTGPCIALDTACSSALVAVHSACDSLRKGECDAALAASVNLILAPEATVAFSKARMMSPDGRCQTFDERANGYVRSEGAAVLVLKTLSRARADGDRILALVRGSAVNQDGASGGLTVPNGPSQVALVRQALARAGVRPEEVDYLEAHGTGTALGDPIEVGALSEVFGTSHSKGRPLLLGSAKTLVGHLEVAAGMAGLIKVILSMQHETIPGYPQLQRLSSHVPWARLPFEVPTGNRPWPRGGKRRIAGVSSFGFSGTNAHLVLEEAPAHESSSGADPAQPAHLLCLSARTPEALQALAGRYAAWLGDRPGVALDAFCWTAGLGRAHLPERLALLAASPGELKEKLSAVASGGADPGPGILRAATPTGAGPVAFLFSGQGAQYPGMGRELYDLHPAFRAGIDRCEVILREHLDRPLKALLWGEDSGRLNETAYTQPALFAFEYALARIWRDWGVRPDFVLGHSVGEFAAACIAGVFSLEDGLALIAARGRLMQALPRDGAMAVVLAGREVVEPEVAPLADRLSVAAFNAPEQTVISGDRAAVLDVCARLEARGIRNKGLLDVSHAFHSPLMRPMLAEFEAVANGIRYSVPELGFVSNLTGQLAGEEVAEAGYWVRHVLAPVDFMAGMRALAASGAELLVEVGPKATLIGLSRDCDCEGRFTLVSSLRQNAGDWSQMLRSLGTLYVHGVVPDWRRAGRCDQRPPSRLALPTYPFQRQRYWLRKGGGRFAVRGAEAVGHPLLGQRLPSAALPPGDFQYQAVLAAGRPHYLKDHEVYDKVVVPAAAYVEMVLAGLALQFPGRAVALANVSVQAALVLPPQGEVLLQGVFAEADENRYRARICSTPLGTAEAPVEDAPWQIHAAAEIELLPPDGAGEAGRIDLAELRRRFAEEGGTVSPDAFYARYRALGLQYGESFRTVRWVGRMAGGEGGAGECLAEIGLPRDLRDRLDEYVSHPALLDGCFQSLGALLDDQAGSLAWLPVGIERIRFRRPLPAELWSHAVLRPQAQGGSPRVVADIRLLDPEGEVVGTVEGLQAVPVMRQALAFVAANWKDKFYTLTWMPAPRQDGAAAALAPGTWLVLADGGGMADLLAERLAAAGHRCVQVRSDDLAFLEKDGWATLLADCFQNGASPFRGILHLWALDEAGEALDATQARLCGSTLALLQALMEMPGRHLPRLWLATRGAQAVAEGDAAEPAQAPLWGFGRSIAIEHPSLDCTCLDLEPGGEDVEALTAELLRPEAEGQIAWRGGRRFVARLNRAVSLQPKDGLGIPEGPWRLRTAGYGSLDKLGFVPMERSEPAPHEVEIEVAAAAVNFKDVLYCLGMLKEFSEAMGILRSEDQPLGFECAGRVVRVGSAVSDLSPGDEVFAMAPSAMATHVTVDRRLAHRKPANLGFEQAASLPTVFMTAIYSLERLARVKAGETVLIHAGAGGVGQAALQIARRAGATVLATASPGKWAFLKQQGVAHVMNSRSLEFIDEVMRVTGRRGVDVVVNSLTGDFIPRSADVLAKGGRFIEIGKIGIWDRERMAAYRPDVFYASFDLGEIDESEGGLQAKLLSDVVAALEQGLLAPLPVKTFPILKAEAAFRHLAQAKNIGKVVLSLPPPGQPSLPVRPDRSYLVTGGLGSLGLQVARSLVDLGAREILLSGRSSPGEAAAAAIKALRQHGAEVRVEIVDVADEAQVGALLGRMRAEMMPLGGIVHAAGILDDGVIVKQSWERFAGVMAPKVAGAWNLHRATLRLKLDFFVMFSSIASLLGAPGQANYAAANAFMDALAQYRRSHGLPAVSVNWGPWAASGMAERTHLANRARFENFGLARLSVADGIEIFEHLLTTRPAAVAVVDMNWSKFLKGVTSANTARFYSLLDKSFSLAAVEEAGALLERLQAAPEGERESMLVDYLRRQVAGVIGLSSHDQIGLRQPLLKLGIDSLMAVELKNRIESGLRCTLNPTLLFDYPTLETLGTHLVRDVLKLTGVAAAPREAPRSSGASDPDQPLATMTETSVEAEGRSLRVCCWGGAAGPLAIVVHGILDQAASWDEVAVGLTEKGWRVLAPDLRGHGRSSHHPPASTLTVMDFVMDLRAVVSALRPEEPFTLVGHSIGSVVAALFAALHSKKVGRLVMVEPVVPYLREQQGPLELLGNDLRYMSEPPPHPAYEDLATAARMLTLNHGRLSLERSMKLARRITEPCAGGLRWTWDPRLRNPLGVDLCLSRQRYLATLSELTLPSVRVYGTASQFAGSSVLLDPALSLPLSRCVTVEGGHNLHTDNAADLLQVVLSREPLRRSEAFAK